MHLTKSHDQRAMQAVPTWAMLLLLVLLGLQISWRVLQTPPTAQAQDLPSPLSLHGARLASLGEPITLAGLLALRLQAFDNQPGISIPFARLDYGLVINWLDLIQDLDPQAQYPLLMASHVYAQVPDPAKQRLMLEYTYHRYSKDPTNYWRYLAHAAILAKHRLQDLPLALRYAKALQAEAQNPKIPSWASQMSIFLLEDLNELEAARIELGALLTSGSIRDPKENHFLMQRFQELEARLSKSQPSR